MGQLRMAFAKRIIVAKVNEASSQAAAATGRMGGGVEAACACTATSHSATAQTPPRTRQFDSTYWQAYWQV